MKVSIDISMYPLQDDYCQPIVDFIDRLDANPAVSVQRNSMSTHIYGDYRAVMDVLDAEILAVFEEIPSTMFVVKLIGKDREKAKIRACE